MTEKLKWRYLMQAYRDKKQQKQKKLQLKP